MFAGMMKMQEDESEEDDGKKNLNTDVCAATKLSYNIKNWNI